MIRIDDARAQGRARWISVTRDASFWIERLALVRHPEGGYFRETYRAAGRVANRPHSTAIALVGCTVAPGFDFADFEDAVRSDLVARYPRQRAVIERLTRP